MSEKSIAAIMYDFDKTLCTRDMQDYQFIPSLGMTSSQFWQEANIFGREKEMDSVLAYMYTMIREAKRKNVPVFRETLVNQGKSVELFKGLDTWFDRMDEFGKSQGVQVEHYVISSGLKEIIEGTSISRKFKKIFACEFYYDDETKQAVWPITAVNYTNKTQFVYRINKGVLDVSNDEDLNRSMPDSVKRVPFTNMVYIGDGLSDVPCMKMMKSYGGQAIAVYQNDNPKVRELLKRGRVDYIFPADYSENSSLEMTIKNIIRKIAVCDKLYFENVRQKIFISGVQG
ncbi:MAG: haloacid dehalogenase-like hydrolase [Anaeromassilibacillus sp.]|nr:haloacid dehalogenase-like hydrolase [Anaeromassilibacillus sp.]MDY3778875.1 haloacid dehalogenase-like hydrolase [Candidatus Limousia pullorum]